MFFFIILNKPKFFLLITETNMLKRKNLSFKLVKYCRCSKLL